MKYYSQIIEQMLNKYLLNWLLDLFSFHKYRMNSFYIVF
jgi:hypothetical protein